MLDKNAILSKPLTARMVSAVLRKAGWKASKKVGVYPWQAGSNAGNAMMSEGVQSMTLSDGTVLVTYYPDLNIKADDRMRSEDAMYSLLVSHLMAAGIDAKYNMFLFGIKCSGYKTTR